jgi:hypothetical protein
MTIIDWIKKNVREGVNIAEAEELAKDLDPLKNIITQEDALKFIDRNPVFKGALDAETSRRVEKHDEKVFPARFEKERAKIREEVEKELNPDMTPEQKKIRELEEWKEGQLKKDQENQLKTELRSKATEIGFDPIKAERYVVYGQEALKFLEDDHKSIDSQVKSQLDKELKGRFKGEPPKAPKQDDPSKIMDRSAFEGMNANQQMEFMKSGGELTEE